MPQASEDVRPRVEALVGEWNVRVQETSETEGPQAVLSAIWAVEDGFPVEADNPAVALAHTLRAMLT